MRMPREIFMALKCGLHSAETVLSEKFCYIDSIFELIKLHCNKESILHACLVVGYKYIPHRLICTSLSNKSNLRKHGESRKKCENL